MKHLCSCISYYMVHTSNQHVSDQYLLPSVHPAVPFLNVNKTWFIEESAPAGTLVDTVVVEDLSGDGYSVELHDSTGILQINPKTGQVTAAAPPTHQQVDPLICLYI